MTDELKRLAMIQTQLQGLRQLLPPAVLAARAQGASWRQIGEALGMSKQAAQRRFGAGPRDIGQLPLTDPVFDVLFNTPQE